jgi:hypothetical protein
MSALQGVPKRLAELRPETPARWGRMSAHQMVCHLADTFRMALGERPVEELFNRPVRVVMRWAGLYVPVPFPRGAPTLPVLDQRRQGTPPGDFEADRAELLALLDRFLAAGPSLAGNAHPLFGPLTEREWRRWAEKHTDHHLRQFGL